MAVLGTPAAAAAPVYPLRPTTDRMNASGNNQKMRNFLRSEISAAEVLLRAVQTTRQEALVAHMRWLR